MRSPRMIGATLSTRTPARPSVVCAAVLVLLVATSVTSSPAYADDVRDGQWYLGPMGITAAQAITSGDGVKVAVVDSGVDGSVQDLRGAVTAGKDFSGKGSSNGQRPVDRAHHGTNVASLLAGRGHGSGAGVIGVAPRAQLLSASIKTLSDTSGDQVAAAVRWSVDAGARVINLSFGGGAGAPELAAYRYAQSKDVVLVAGSGNDGSDQLEPPCSLAGVVCVGGIDRNLQHDPKSNTGRRLSIVGPYATRAGSEKTPDDLARLPAVEPALAPTLYAGVAGTSFATPVVAGTVALIRAKFPQLNAANVINRLLRTATPAGNGRPNESYGWGIVDAHRALTADVPTVKRNPLGSLVPAVAASPQSGQSEQPTPPSLIGGAHDSGGVSTDLVVGVVLAVMVIVFFAFLRRRMRRSKM